MATALALLASLLWGTSDFLGGTAARRLAATAVVAISQAFALAGLIVVALATAAFGADTGYLGWALGAAVVGVIALSCFYAALAAGTMGVVAPIAAVGVVVPVGRLPVTQAMTIADIADRYGSGEIRLTVWQNLVIPNIPTEHLEAAKQALLEAGMDFRAGMVSSGTVACTGNQGCRFAATDTKSHAVELADRLDCRFNIDQPINLHVTGCPHSCAQHYIGDIGLLGTKVGGEEGYTVVIGGGSDHDQGLARELVPSIRYTELPPLMERLFGAYITRRAPGESFLQFTRRHSIAELKDLCVVRELV